VAKFYHSGDKTGPAAARYENHFWFITGGFRPRLQVMASPAGTGNWHWWTVWTQ